MKQFPIVIMLAALFCGCTALTLSPYDAQAYQYLSRMQAYHFQIIDDVTVNRPTLQQIESECKAGDLVFREADTYVTGRAKKDPLREKAFANLTEAFQGDCADFIDRAKTKDAFPTPTAAKELKQEHAENYSFAMQGEWARVGANK